MASSDLRRLLETHHYVARLNQDFLQCTIYDSDQPTARLIGDEYIISDRFFESLPPEEQKLWHSHAYEIKSGLWINLRVPEMIEKPELESLIKTYGKCWCTSWGPPPHGCPCGHDVTAGSECWDGASRPR